MTSLSVYKHNAQTNTSFGFSYIEDECNYALSAETVVCFCSEFNYRNECTPIVFSWILQIDNNQAEVGRIPIRSNDHFCFCVRNIL